MSCRNEYFPLPRGMQQVQPQQNVPMKAHSETQSSKSSRRRRKAAFSEVVKLAAWKKATKIIGLDPALWRLDSLGNICFWELHGWKGVFEWQYAHITPVSKNGDGSLSNCQILLSKINLWKSDKEPYEEELIAQCTYDYKEL